MSPSGYRLALPSHSLTFKEVVEFGLRVQVLFEPEDPFPIDDIPDFAVRIEEVAKFSGPGGACLHTGRISSLPYPLNTEGALIDSTFHPGSVPEVMDGGIDLLFWNVWIGPIEDSPLVGTGGDAVSASDAPVIINDHDPIGFLPCGVDRADLDAGGVLTLLALHRKIKEPRLRNKVRIVEMFGVFKVNQVSPLEPENTNPLELGVMARVVVFFHTRVNAPPAADAAREFKTVPQTVSGGASWVLIWNFFPYRCSYRFSSFATTPTFFLRRPFPQNASGGSLRPPPSCRTREGGVKTLQALQRGVPKEFPSCPVPIFHDGFPRAGQEEVPV